MKNAILVCSTWKGMQGQTDDTIKLLERRFGLSNIIERDSTDVSLARNIALTTVCRVMEEHTRLDTCVMCDDDMLLYNPPHDVQLLIDHSRKTGVPASGVYINTANELCATPYLDRWKVGLGLLAISREILFELRKNSYVFDMRGTPTYEFTWSGVDRETLIWEAEAFRLSKRLGEAVLATTNKGAANWHSSDHRLTARMGGVDLLPDVILGHIKPVALTPTREEVDALIKQADIERKTLHT